MISSEGSGQVFIGTHRCLVPYSRRTSLVKGIHSLAISTGKSKRKALQITLAFRDQNSAGTRLVPTGSEEQKVLHSWTHSLFGQPASLESRFIREKELGQGGNAVVYQVLCRETGKQFACKTIRKELVGDRWSSLKKEGHLDAIRQEVEVLRRLRGSLNIATLEDVYEDEEHVHIVMEMCNGGELVHRIGNKHYSERTVASYIRAVLRTIAQCHSQKILHRDIKPGNFLLLNDDDMAPLKAIDFGLAVPFDPSSLPKEDLGLEGTPWYQAPEALSSKVGPAADVWSAGVMAFQLLTGRFPFDDKQNPFQPSVTKIWQSILTDKLNFKKSYWEGISQEGKDFVAYLLERDASKRPTAQEALQLPWLQGKAKERTTGKQLSLSIVQRIQRYSQSSLLKRTALQLIAEDMLAHAVQQAQETSCPISPEAKAIVTDPQESALGFLFESADFGDSDHISRQQLSCTLQSLGYRIDLNETEALLDYLDTAHTGEVKKGQLAASQLDWAVLQQENMPRFLAAARRAFESLDRDGDGFWSANEILECLKSKLSPTEVSAALQQAMQEAAKRDESIHEGLSFEAFLIMLRADGQDSLDKFDDRMGSPAEALSVLLDTGCQAEYMLKEDTAFFKQFR